MKFVHTFWSKPLLSNKFNTYQELLPVILSDYAYSAACIKAQGHSIRLFTDKIGVEMLGFIPYDEIVIVESLDKQSIHFAAQIKFEALKCMSLDEYLIDGDLFIRKPAAFERLKSFDQDFIYSFYEPTSFILASEFHMNKYIRMSEILKKYQSSFTSPYELDKDINEYNWPNTSLMKFNNQELKDEYLRQYSYFKQILENEEFGSVWPDIIIEQRHMDKLLKYNPNFTSTPVIEGFPEPEANNYALEIGFTHLGVGKIMYRDIIFSWLKELDNDLFIKTIQQIEKFMKV